MSMISAQREIVKKSCFSTDRVAETITYNGVEITALVEIGPTLSRTDWNNAATTIEEARLANIAVFSVLDTDVANPTEGDHIVYNNETYNVSRIANYDKAGGHWLVEAMRSGKAFGR